MRHALPIALLGAYITACSVAPPPADRFYRIEPERPAAQQSFSHRVLVETVQASGLYAERPLVLQREAAGGALEQYHYSFWSEAPDLLLTDALVQYLRAALGPQQVVTAGGGADRVVRTRLRKLDQRLGPNTGSVLALEFTVLDNRGAIRSVLDFEETAPAASAAPTDHVQAINQLCAKAFGQLVERLAGRDAE